MGGHIHSTTDYDEYTGPGLYHIYNLDGGTMLDNGGKGYNACHGWNYEENNNNQKWMIAGVSANKVILMCRTDLQLLGATGSGARLVSNANAPENEANQWYIEHSDGDQKKLYIKSVKYHGSVVEMENGDEAQKTPINLQRRNGDVEGQLWLVKRIPDLK